MSEIKYPKAFKIGNKVLHDPSGNLTSFQEGIITDMVYNMESGCMVNILVTRSSDIGKPSNECFPVGSEMIIGANSIDTVTSEKHVNKARLSILDTLNEHILNEIIKD